MNPFESLIRQFLYQSFPLVPPPAEIRDETIWKAVLGTKQRRHGPVPPPETQVALREVLRRPGPTTFFVACGASKQEPGRNNIDVAEVSAVKQLACLQAELGRYGKKSRFVFRLEDLADRYLLGDTPTRREMVETYVRNFSRLVHLILGDIEVRLESDCTTYPKLSAAADDFRPYFQGYLENASGGGRGYLEHLQTKGWVGNVTEAQRDYYRRAYSALGIPEDRHVPEMAKYFASVLARKTTGALRLPPAGSYIPLAFTHPLPDSPGTGPRLYYRTVPERYTHYHQSPWLAKGYLRITDGDDEVTPRLITKEDTALRLIPNTLEWNGVTVDTPYVLV